jgi:NAD(P)-dependent dehydrogenase (short-subunit alcohol dehydrogenase family)
MPDQKTPDRKTAIITGAAGGIGAGTVQGFLNAGYRVVATSRDTKSLTASPDLVLMNGDIANPDTAAKVADAAIQRFGSIEVLVNTAGIYRKNSFTNYTTDDINALISTNLLGFLYITQLAVKQMIKQQSGCVVTISAGLADHPVAGVNASIAMMTKGALNTITRNLATEYAAQGIRFNAVAPGVVATPLHTDVAAAAQEERQPMKTITQVSDIVDAILYLARANQVSGEILYVDGGSHAGR